MSKYDSPLSPSTINTYLSCPYSLYLKKIRGIKIDSGDAAIFGSFNHKVYENFWGFYTLELDPEFAIKESIKKYDGPKIQPEYEIASYTCFNNFVSIIQETPTLIPTYTELRCENPTNNTVAIIDVVYPSKIVDYKTSTQYTVNPKLPNKIQATMCSQNLLKVKGIEVRQVEFWYLRYKKYQRVTVDQKLIEEVDEIIDYVREGIEQDHFPKYDNNCFFCDYKKICELEKKNLTRIQKRMVKQNVI